MLVRPAYLDIVAFGREGFDVRIKAVPGLIYAHVLIECVGCVTRRVLHVFVIASSAAQPVWIF